MNPTSWTNPRFLAGRTNNATSGLSINGPNNKVRWSYPCLNRADRFHSRVATHAATSQRACVVIVGTSSSTDEPAALGQLAERVRSHTGLEALIITPEDEATHGATATAAAAAATPHISSRAGDYSFGRRLQLKCQPDCGPLYYSIGPGATGADAMLLGIPSIAACLASPSPGAPISGAAAAAALLAAQALTALKQCSSIPACNYPRAHYPLPTRGRWALGRELPLPRSAIESGSGVGAAANTSTSPHGLAGRDCWALGDDGSWFGGRSGEVGAVGMKRDEAVRLLRTAFSEGGEPACAAIVWC